LEAKLLVFRSRAITRSPAHPILLPRCARAA
jgi:hypothetical protein